MKKRGVFNWLLLLFILSCQWMMPAMYGQSLRWTNLLRSEAGSQGQGAFLDGSIDQQGALVAILRSTDSQYEDANGSITQYSSAYTVVGLSNEGAVRWNTDFSVDALSNLGSFIFTQLRVDQRNHTFIAGFTQGSFDMTVGTGTITVRTSGDDRRNLLLVELDQNGSYVQHRMISVNLEIYGLQGFEFADNGDIILLYTLIDTFVNRGEDEFRVKQFIRVYSSDWELQRELEFSGRSQNRSSATNPGFLLYGMAIANDRSVYLTGYLHRGETTDLDEELRIDDNINNALIVKLNADLEYEWFRAISAQNATASQPVVFSDGTVAYYVNTVASPGKATTIQGTEDLFENRNLDGFDAHVVKFDTEGNAEWMNSWNRTLSQGVARSNQFLAVDQEDQLYVPFTVNFSDGAMESRSSDGSSVQLMEAHTRRINQLYGFQRFSLDGRSLGHKLLERSEQGRITPNYFLIPGIECQSFYLLGQFFDVFDLDFGPDQALINNSDRRGDYFLASYGNEVPTIEADMTEFAVCSTESLEIPITFSDENPDRLIWSMNSSDPSILPEQLISLQLNGDDGLLTVSQSLKKGNVELTLNALDECGAEETRTFSLAFSETPDTPSLNTSEDLLELCEGETFVLASSFNTGNVWSTGATTQSIVVDSPGTYWVKQVNEAGCESDTSATVEFIFSEPLRKPEITASGPLEICEGESVVLSTDLTSGAVWSTGETGSEITVTESGIYSVFQRSEKCGDGLLSDVVEVNVIPTPQQPQIQINGSLQFCEGDELVLVSSSETGNVWSNGATSREIRVTESGEYWVKTVRNGCEGPPSEVVTVVVDEDFDVSLISDAKVCPEVETIELVPEVSHPDLDFLWSDGSTGNSLVIDDKGDYWLEVSNGSCRKRAFVKVDEECYPVLYVPSAFTPNGDRENDVFEPKGQRVTAYELLIYNTWGTLIFRSTKIGDGWNGEYQNQPAPQGIYSYRISYGGMVSNQPISFSKAGTVRLIR